VRNVQKVAAGTGEAIPSRSVLRSGVDNFSVTGVEPPGVRGGRITDRAVRTAQPPVREGPILRSRAVLGRRVR
jgi:hypothetical protein